MLATGGGAFNDPETRRLIRANAVSIWLRADLEVLAARVRKRDTRPLVIGKEPIDVLRVQARDRYPTFAEADLVVDTGESPHHITVDAIVRALASHAPASAP